MVEGGTWQARAILLALPANERTRTSFKAIWNCVVLIFGRS